MSRESTILLTGANGQIGHALRERLGRFGTVVATSRDGSVGRVLDLASPDSIRDSVRALKPTLIVNPAAYTAVDRAESEPELASRINAHAPAVFAAEARRCGAALVHFSTDYVYDGQGDEPRDEGADTGPLNVYGRTKLAGDQAIVDSGVPHLILRTSWVYSLRGANFLLTMRRLLAERANVRVVADQIGAPTWSVTVAEALIGALDSIHADGIADIASASGIYHVTARGETSWHGFALAIRDELGLDCAIDPIASTDWPTPACRPLNSRLDCARFERRFNVELPDWRVALRRCLQEGD
ncbi:MAG: dTDP-4-dehydrorhamnose reductase [Chromatiales bacterium]|nr:dTDP-4-dehydrorhamnose reductase [Chromatiales bacterium]